MFEEGSFLGWRLLLERGCPLKGFKKTCMTFFLIKTNFLRLEKSTF